MIPDLAFHTKSLRSCTSVTHQDAAKKGEHHESRVDAALSPWMRQEIGDARQDQAFGHPVERRIEEGAERRGHLREAGQRAVEHVEQMPATSSKDARVDEVIEDDQGRHTHVEHGAGDGDRVGGDPEPVESGEERR